MEQELHRHRATKYNKIPQLYERYIKRQQIASRKKKDLLNVSLIKFSENEGFDPATTREKEDLSLFQINQVPLSQTKEIQNIEDQSLFQINQVINQMNEGEHPREKRKKIAQQAISK